jgi:predicted amidohydrolase
MSSKYFLAPSLTVLVALLAPLRAPAQPGSPARGHAFQGRIAYSCDGNHNDPDDWASSAVALAIFAEAGLRDRLVHVDYNCILPKTDPEWEKIHAQSVLGAAERYGFDRSLLHDCRRDLDGAVASIARAVNASSADNPLYFILAGPMEVPYLGIQEADPAKRQFVYCISHSSWNDGYSTRYKYPHTKRSVIEQDVRWVQIRGQHRLSTSPYGRAALPEEWRPFHWMRDARDARVRWLWDRLVISTRPDCSDAGMAWFVATGDESCDPAKLKALLDDRRPLAVAAARAQVRLEAENFRHLDGCTVEYRNDRKASQSVQVALSADAGRIRTRFDEPYIQSQGRYDVAVRYLDEKGSRSRFKLLVNGAAQGAAWESAGQGGGWTTRTLRDVPVRAGDELAVEVSGKPARLDYVELNATTAGAAVPGAAPGLLRIAVVQMALRPTLAENRDRIVAGIAQAAEREARVAVFPERALTGSGSEQQDLVDAAVAVIREAARVRRINVVFGAHTWLPSIQKAGNWMLAVGPDGRELLRYEKLYNNHRATMPGVFEVDGVPCGTAICADRWLRGVVEVPIQQGARIHFELSNNYACEWVAPYGWYWNAPLAMRNTVWSVLANSGNLVSGAAASGDGLGLKHGHSAIIAPDGRVVAAARGDSEDLVVADIDPAEATRAGATARATHPALRPFWQAGLKLHRGETLSVPPLRPLQSAETEVTLAAAAAAADLPRLETLIREARARKADLVAFPAEAVPASALGRLCAAAKANEITVVFGTKYRDAIGWHSSAYVVGPDGSVLTRYDQLSAAAPLEAGKDAGAMWFRVKGVPAVVTIGRDALWTELAELAAVAGAQIHVHLDCDPDDGPAARQRRLQTWANFASFLTFTATANMIEAALWDDLRGRDESRAVVRGLPKPDLGVVEVESPFSANLVARAERDTLVVATRRVPALNPYHPSRTANLNPQMKPWYELGANLLHPR